MTYYPTKADVHDALQQTIRVLEDTFQNEGVGSNSAYTNIESLLAAVQFPGDSGIRAAAFGYRRGLAASLVTLGRAMLDEVFRLYLVLAGKPTSGSPLARWSDIVQYWEDEGDTIEDPDITTTFTKTAGTGVINAYVLNHDWLGVKMASQLPGTWTFEVLASEPGTQPGETQLVGTLAPRIDLFSLLKAGESNGDGRAFRVNLKNDSGLLQNANFSTPRATVAKGALTSLAGWIDRDGASFAKIAIVEDSYRQASDAALYYRQDTNNNPEFLCVEVDDDIDITQYIVLAFDRAYGVGVWLKRRNSATGNAILTCGAISRTFDISALTNNTWTFVPLVDASADPRLNKNYWGRNLAAPAAEFRLQTTSIATGELRIANCRLVERQAINGSWIDFEPGNTFVQQDYTATLAFAYAVTRRIIAAWLLYVYGPAAYLPVGKSVGYLAGGGQTLTFASADNSVTKSSGNFLNAGIRPGMLITVAGTSSNNCASKKVLTVTASKVTYDNTAVNEGPLSATATIMFSVTVLDI